MADANITLDKSALKEAVVLGQKIGQPVTTESIHFALVPEGTKIESLINLQYPDGLRPGRIKQHPHFRDWKSFAGYVNLYKDDRTRVFAEPKSMAFLAVLDYHGIGERAPEFLSHRASYAMVLDERWKLWSSKSEAVFTQNDFAEFIEDNVADIIDPAGAVMLEVARDLHAKTDVNFDSKVTPKNGQVQLKYTETINAGVGAGNMEVPEFFKIRIPVFYGEAPIVIDARLRFRISGGRLTFFYKLYRQQEILDTAFSVAVKSVSDDVGVEVLLGAPEVK